MTTSPDTSPASSGARVRTHVIVVRERTTESPRDLTALLRAGPHHWHDVAIDVAGDGPGDTDQPGSDRGQPVANLLADLPDPAAIVVVASGRAADAAIHAASFDARIRGIVLLTAVLSERSVELVTEWKEVPTFVVADGERPALLPAALDVHEHSAHPDRRLEFVTNLDVGDTGETAVERRDQQYARVGRAVVAWITRLLDTIGEQRAVRCRSDDGWEIHGTLTVPRSNGAPVPAAVLLHSGRSDRAVFSRLAMLLARRGVASVNIDWRGRGMSQNLGTYFELDADQRAEGWRDARAAMSILADHPGIDEQRVAMIGVVHGAEHAVAASIDDPRVRMLVVLTGYVPRNERERSYLVSGDAAVRYVSCDGHGPVTGVMRELVAATPAGRAALRTYPGGAIGYQLFDLDDRLEDDIAGWVTSGLDAGGET